MLEPIPFAGYMEIDEMNNEPVALTQADILGILQDAYSVPLGQPIFNSSEEYNKLKAIIESAIRYTHPVNTCKHGVDDGACKECYMESTHPAELTDEEIEEFKQAASYYSIECSSLTGIQEFIKAILRKASEK